MTNTLKAAKLDVYMSKIYLNQYLLLLVLPIMFIFLFKHIDTGILFTMCALAMEANFTFAIAEKNNVNRLYGMIPIKKNELVSGKYVFIGTLGIVFIITCTILGMAASKILSYNIAPSEYFTGISTGIFIYFMSTAIQLPIYYKFGSIKTKLVSIIPYVAYVGLIYISIKLNPKSMILQQLLKNPYFSVIISILLSIIFYSISIKISSGVMRKKEL